MLLFLQQAEEGASRNSAFLAHIVKSSDDTVYTRLIECLHRVGQPRIANLLVDVSEELTILNQSKRIS